mmetsp:Transcript_30725/g.95056  ORF Transcript_30725/g.95056 Transcript_30725/m.95056 type:complete len:268 (-) Transcript_30725:1720-2523(-)
MTYHTAKNKEEFMMLVTSARSVKAALSFQSDMFLHCAHMHIHCVCMHQKAISFVELGTRVLAKGMAENTSHLAASLVERSLQSAQRYTNATCGRTAAAYICGSALTTRLVDVFANDLPVVWLACLSQTLIDRDEALETLRFITRIRDLPGRVLRAANSTSRKFCGLFEQKCSTYLPKGRERIKKTSEQTLARRIWIENLGLREAGRLCITSQVGYFLFHVSSDVRIGRPSPDGILKIDDLTGITVEPPGYHLGGPQKDNYWKGASRK